MQIQWARQVLDENEDKTKFAEALLRNPGEPLHCALDLFGHNDSRIQNIVSNWPFDSFVLSEKKRLLKEHGEEFFLPTKCEILREIHKKAKATNNTEDYGKLMKLYAEMRTGFIEKPGIKIDQNKTTTVNVMVVPVSTNSDEWEKTIEAQQSALLGEAVVN